MTTYIKGTFPVRFRRDGKDGESAYLNTITLRGTSKSDTANPVGTATIRVNGETTSYVTSMSDGYGINMWVINRNTLEVTGNVGYTSTSPVNGSVFHAILSGINDNAFIAIVSWGQFCMPDDIALKLNDFGGDFNGKMSFGRRAFAFIGYRGLARGRALQVVNEGDGLTAEISTTVIDGMIQLGSKDGENGKDGKTYYTWVKYADALDNEGYPSEMYDSPKPTTQYIGISYNNESATEGTSPTSYTWTKIKGENGVDGTSFKVRGTCEEVYTYDAFNEDVEKVVGKIYLLEDPDAEDFNAMAVKWTSSGQEDLKAVDGDAFVKESNKVLFVKDRNVWRDLGTIQGPKGDKGNDGQDAVNYRLESSVKAIHLNNDGSPQITEFTLNAYMFKGSMSMPFDDTYNIVALISHSGSIYPVTKSCKLSSNVSYFTVELTDDKGNIINNIKSITCSLYRGGIKYDSFAILPIKAGAAGVSYFPNMCGVWDGANTTYKWTNGSRDMVTYYISGTPYLFAVKTAGTTISASANNATPDKDSRWEKADSPFSMLFANFVYADNASVAGFIWSAEKMKSSSGLLELDGKKGTIKCSSVELKGTINATGGTIGEFVIRDKGLGLACKADEADILMTCQSNTKRNARIYVTPKYDNAVIYASTDTTTAAHFYAWNSKGTALKVNGKTDISGEVSIIGNTTLSGLVSGLRLDATTMSSGGTIPSNSDIICFTNSSNITVTMPNPVTYEGRILFLKRTGSGGVTLNGSFVRADGTGTATSREHVGNAKSMIYVSNGTFWIEFYCG